MSLEVHGPDIRLAALGGLIDYAGLFPPARLDMAAAVGGYQTARRGPNAWMIDRFLCPASRLVELAGSLHGAMTEDEDPWRLSVIADGDADTVADDARSIESFDRVMDGRARVEVVETQLPVSDAADWVVHAAEVLDRPVFFEVPWRDGAPEALDSVTAGGERTGRELGAKLRCGGLTAAAFPPPGVVAAIIAGCRDRRLRLKATAGLHHPFRHFEPETGFTQHGFVNLLVAAAAGSDGVDLATLTEIVAEDDSSAFSFDDGYLRWRDRSFDAATVAASRAGLFVGYGSCSIEEPVQDLTVLGVLPLGAAS
ncbi:MAG: hypothetical protein A2Z12_01365 [Actinobacteria bacterium RBG_16_68_21]|nr:MAG: hypothetical protein A2Z12_01365 [Actinobacteria bacterium RBG_16_68_21]